jgi:polyhydroxyalkanoate synthase subunit PhaC
VNGEVVPAALGAVADGSRGGPVHAVTATDRAIGSAGLEVAPGGHLGVLTGREARATTWLLVDSFLAEHDPIVSEAEGRR